MPEITNDKTGEGFAFSSRKLFSFLPVVVFTFIYFFEVTVRASEKLFWYDELLTLYFSRLTLPALWPALGSGVDFNPPLFYVITRATEGIFGEGLVSTRLPEMFGFWLFCICLFVFVSRRAGYFAGTLSMIFPMLTGAFYYAYEARPHGIVLGCCGLALLFWQRTIEKPESKRLYLGFSLSLFAGFMLHCYALLLIIPFACTELLLRQRWRWNFWAALLIPTLPAAAMYLPLLISYQRTTKGTPFAQWFPANWSQVTHFYEFLLGPIILIIFVVLVLTLIDRTGLYSQSSDSIPRTSIPPGEVILALSFLFMPVFGILLAKVVHGPFFSRYFQSALAGVCILLGFGIAPRRTMNWVAVLTGSVLIVAFVFNAAQLARHWHKGWPERLAEPSTGLEFSGTPRDPLAGDPLLANAQKGNLPIDILDPLVYLYYVHYEPTLSKRLFCALPSRENISYRFLRSLRDQFGLKFNREVTYSEFRNSHKEFLVYGPLGVLDQLSSLEGTDNKEKSLVVSGFHFIADVEMPDGYH